MDIDALRGKNAHDQLIQSFEQKKIDILVGTQMVVKGLDFENVDLVAFWMQMPYWDSRISG